MWRLRLPDGTLSDMVSITRAKDAARSLASSPFNRPKKAAQEPVIEARWLARYTGSEL